MPEIIKVGPKQKHVEIPDNYIKLNANDVVEKGDKVINLYLAQFETVDLNDDVGLPAEVVGEHVYREIKDAN